MKRTLTATAALLALALAGCGSDQTQPEQPAQPAQETTTAAADPYTVYQSIAPKGAPKLSREDAQTRALLGCGQKWAPGTVDAALAQAYADLCKSQK